MKKHIARERTFQGEDLIQSFQVFPASDDVASDTNVDGKDRHHVLSAYR